ncbi:DUF982 domain-containing protein [Mycoplana sp. BE70]|uniref:DUF982 domain-containing protein n=1 Tax=Mycoplana sp. BE70 TaxID=2817775 RepID=UPI0038620DCF
MIQTHRCRRSVIRHRYRNHHPNACRMKSRCPTQTKTRMSPFAHRPRSSSGLGFILPRFRRRRVMNAGHWKSPVYITTPSGTIIAIRGPDDALAAFAKIWPKGDDEHLSQARRACIDALRRPKTLEEARYAFMGACRDANILAPDSSASPTDPASR